MDVRTPATSFFAGFGDAALFAFKAMRLAWTPPFEVSETIRQVYELGLRSAPLIAVSGVAVGVVLSMHTRASLERFGAESMIPAGLAIALVRETGPLTAGLLLSGRIGAGIGAELGAMRVTEQIDALETLSYDPYAYLVVPRVLAGTMMFPIVVGLAMVIGVAAGWVASVLLLDLSSPDFVKGLRLFFTTFDVRYGLVKSASFGAAVTLIGCMTGMRAEGGAEGVGRAATRAVVYSAITILVLDAFWATVWLLGKSR